MTYLTVQYQFSIWPSLKSIYIKHNEKNTFKAALLQNILKKSLVTNISKYFFKYIE